MMSGLKRKLWLIGFLAGALSGCTAFGATVTTLKDIFSDPMDAGVKADGAGIDRQVKTGTLIVGRTTDMTHDECGVLIFDLSTIPANTHVVTAMLSFLALKSDPVPTFNVDLYGIGLRSSNTVSTDDYSASGELLVNDIVQKTGTYLANQPVTNTDTNLADYINSQLATTTSRYLFLRFSADGLISSGQYFQIGSGDLTRYTSFIRLSVADGAPAVPEVGTVALLGIGVAILLFGPHRSK